LSRRLSVGALSALLLVLPFEARRPTLPVFGLEMTVLEVVAAVATAALLFLGRERLGPILRRPPLPLALLASYVAASALSAAPAPMNRVLAAKFDRAHAQVLIERAGHVTHRQPGKNAPRRRGDVELGRMTGLDDGAGTGRRSRADDVDERFGLSRLRLDHRQRGGMR